MEKIPTIFNRDWDGSRGVVPTLLYRPRGLPTEKLDGTNVRVTVRKGEAVRIEARRNPSKALKQRGIADPWYRDAWQAEQGLELSDRYIGEAVMNTPLTEVPDGEFAAEAVGPKIQGNPLGLDTHRIFFFERYVLPAGLCVPVLADAPQLLPTDSDEDYFESVREYVTKARSRVNVDVGIEGIVWVGRDSFFGKIKAKDFK